MDAIQFRGLGAHSRNFQRLWSYSTGFYGVWLAHIGRTTGLLGLMARKPRSAGELARSGHLYLPAVQAWCSSALAYGLIMKSSRGRFALADSMASILLEKTDPDYLGGQFSYLALRSLEYSALQDLFRHGKVKPISSNFEAVEQATHWDHYAFLRVIKGDPWLHKQLTKGCTFADIGCGTGTLIEKLCKKYPRSRFVGIDPSKHAVALARKRLKGKRATIMRLNAERLSVVDEFDIIYLGESLYAASDRGVFLAKCYQSLVAGGMIMILEGLLPEGKVKQEELLIMGMQLDFALQGLQFLTKTELGKLLRRAGFTQIAFRSLGGSVYLTSAEKGLLGTKEAQ